MSSLVIAALKWMAALLPFLLLCLLGNKVNLKKPYRSKQFPMPFVAVIYGVIAVILLRRLNDFLTRVIYALPGAVSNASNASWMPAGLSDSVKNLSEGIDGVIRSLNIPFWAFFIANCVLILAYIIIKRIIISILSRAISSHSPLHEKVAGVFYDYFPEKDTWCVKDSYAQARTYLKWFYVAATLISMVLTLVSCRLYYQQLLNMIFYPVFGILPIAEMYFYLNGATRREYTVDILGENEDAYKIVNYSLLRKFLRNLFGDKLLSENTGVNSALEYDLTTEEVIENLEKDEDPKICAYASYLRRIHSKGFKLDRSYLSSSIDLMNGKSILFNNPFYNDLIPYAFYPMNRALLEHGKVLVIIGRHSIEENITDWIERGIGAVTNIPFMWNIGVLGRKAGDQDIGIVTRSSVLDVDVHNANEEFLSKVKFVVVIEPSKLMTTAQIGLNILVKKCRGADDDKNITFCICDKNCDGLVDALSHALMISITEVSATEKHSGTLSYMTWETDNEYLHHRIVPNISRYLGVGTELSFAALKNQVSKTVWYGGEAFPVVDMNWVDRQYYYDLMKYAGLPTSQDVMDDHFKTSIDFWSASVSENSYITVEDEPFNMFEILREFSTRSSEQGFVNVIASEYLLKDYMADNASVFETDAKAIPYIAADYVRTRRNTVLRLTLLMSRGFITEEAAEKELSLIGIKAYDIPSQLWLEIYRCYAPADELDSLPGDYKEAVSAALLRALEVNDNPKDAVGVSLIKTKSHYNIAQGKVERVYYIDSKPFIAGCMSSLKSAEYISEDEKGELHYLGAELNEQIYQKYLPGQKFTFGGKYYEMLYLTAAGQIMVRRASDHITSRPFYRQIRKYTFTAVRPSAVIGSQKDIAGMKVIREYADISVETPGYYLMERYNDFAGARKVILGGKLSSVPVRKYCNKEVLRIDLPDMDGLLTEKTVYTVALMFNEVFRTLFAENQAYISAVTCAMPEAETPLTYSLDSAGAEGRNSIYIIEDSQLDLGLMAAVERNLNRIFEIIQDYFDWHNEVLKLSYRGSVPPPVRPILISEPEKKKKKGFFGWISSLVERFRSKFKKKKKDKKKKDDRPAEGPKQADDGEYEFVDEPEGTIPEEGVSADTPAEEQEPNGEDRPVEVEPETEEKDVEEAEGELQDEPEAEAEGEGEPKPDEGGEEGEELRDIPKNDMNAGTGVAEIAEASQPEGPRFERKPYHERYYLLYGGKSVPEAIDVSGTYKYLTAMGFGNNFLKQARSGKDTARLIEETYKPNKPNARYCDFCGVEILGTEYEALSDGRERCINCGRTAVKSEQQFKKLYDDVKRNLEAFFGITINVGIRVRMVTSAKLHRKLGKSFTPTAGYDGRVVGVAIRDKSGYTLMVENGAPTMASMLTMAHELTHIWQYINWDRSALKRLYGKDMLIEVYEGMAKWVEVQYAYLINEPAVAKREEIMTECRNDEYGCGFVRYRANYPLSAGTVLTGKTPFYNTDIPLGLDYCGDISELPQVPYLTGGSDEGEKTYIRSGGSGAASGREYSASSPYADRCRTLLSPEEQGIYDRIVSAALSFEAAVDIPENISSERLREIFSFVRCDRPDMIQLSDGARFIPGENGGKLELAYVYSVSETAEKLSQLEAAAQEMIGKINIADEYSAALSVYEYLVQNIDEAKSSSTDPDVRSAYGALVNKKALCEGYARAAEYILNSIGIECSYVCDGEHAWNLIKLDGEYYWFDAAYGHSATKSAEKFCKGYINRLFFAMTTDTLRDASEHMPDGIFMAPECDSEDCCYHRINGLTFDGGSDEDVLALIGARLRAGEFISDIRFTNPTDYDRVKARCKDTKWLESAATGCGLGLDVSAYCDDGLRMIIAEYK